MGKLSTCEDQIVALLEADSFFIDRTDPLNPIVKVPIVVRKQGDIAAKFEEQLKSLQVALIVVLNQARPLETDTPALAFDCKWALTAVANPTLAIVSGAPRCYDIVERAAQVLQWKYNGVSAVDQTQTSRFTINPDGIRPLPDPRRTALDIQLLLLNTTIDLST